jgi:hypothetical protein
VTREWREIGQNRKCLWLIDDVHTDREEIVPQLVDQFEELALQGHWLVTAGWSASRIEDADIVPWSLTVDTLCFALRAGGHGSFATDEELINTLVRSRVGLMQILWAAHYRPDLLQDRRTDQLEREWATYITEALPPGATNTLAILARLKFFGLPFLPSGMRETQELEEVTRTGWVRQLDTPRGSAEIRDDKIAQLILLREIGNAQDSAGLVRSFLDPLRTYISGLLGQRLLELPGRLLHALRLSRRRALMEWIGSRSLDGNATPLIDDFLDDSMLRAVRTAVVGHQALTEAARVVATVRSRTAWAKETTAAMLAALGPEQLATLSPTDLAAWRALGTLAHLAENATVQDIVSRAADTETIRQAFRRATGPERGNVLDTAKLVSERAYRAFLTVLRQSLVEEVRAVHPRGAWRRLATLAHREPSEAVALLESLGPGVVDDLLFAAPSAARQFLARFDPRRCPAERRRVAALFDRALTTRKVADVDVSRWSGSPDLISLVFLARREPQAIDVDPVLRQVTHVVQATDPGIITNLTHDVAKFGRYTNLRRHLAQTVLVTLQQGKDPLVERLEAIARLDHSLLTQDLLASSISRWRDLEPNRIFRLLWLAVAASPGRPGPGRNLAREIVSNWRSIAGAAAPLTALAISGLCMFALGEEQDALGVAGLVPLADLVEPSQDTPPPTTPQLTVCQVLALARALSGPASPGYGNLVWLAAHVAQPSRRYHRAWHRMAPASARRLGLEILCSGLRTVAGANLPSVAKTLALGIASPEQDDIWDEHLMLRLEAARLGAGEATARQLLQRRCDAWLDRIEKRILQPRPDRPVGKSAIDAVLRFLEGAVDLAAPGDDASKTCVRKLLDAVTRRLPMWRQAEVTPLRARLGDP